MPQKNHTSDDYKKIEAAVNAGTVGNFYIFHGEERYLRDRCLDMLRKHLCPDGLGGFNYKRFDGKNFSIHAMAEAIDTLPVFSDRTLIEIHDFELFTKKKETDEPPDDKPKKKDSKKAQNTNDPPILKILSSLPDYVCILFVYDTIEYKPDGRTKTAKEITQHAQVIAFGLQDRNNLIKWIMNHYKNAGKRITVSDAEHLINITGGYMSMLKNEIEKTSAYSKSGHIMRSDIDAVVMPVLDAVVYQLTDALIKRENTKSMRLLDDLLNMREAPQKLIFSISLKMRQLLAARVCLENKLGKAALLTMCSLNHDFQAQQLLDTARRSTLPACCRAVVDCAQAAYDLNSTSDPESRLVELVAKLALS